MRKEYYTYIITNPKQTVFYTGVTKDLQARIIQHYLKRGSKNTFAGKYYCYCLIWYDVFPTIYEAIQAEKYIKGKNRKWKLKLISGSNPEFKFLNKIVLGEWPPSKTLNS